MNYWVKILVTSLLVVAIAEIAKRSSLIAAALASVPLVSVLAMIWLYMDTGSVERVSALATNVFWLVLPSLVLFLALPLLLKQGLNFYLSLGIAVTLTVISYGVMLQLMGHLGLSR